VQNVNRSRTKVNQRTNLGVNLCLHHVHKRADIVLGLLFLFVNFLGINVLRNRIKFCGNIIRKFSRSFRWALTRAASHFAWERTDASSEIYFESPSKTGASDSEYLWSIQEMFSKMFLVSMPTV
ncbi:MAG: hypothetical protein II716_10350, partial [Treponema sp.]|nr:hypothetical protein [Treponema sp.]